MATEDKKPVKVVDAVSQDRNWVLRINGEMKAQNEWDKEFGYLSGGKLYDNLGFSPEKTNSKPSIQDKIKEL